MRPGVSTSGRPIIDDGDGDGDGDGDDGGGGGSSACLRESAEASVESASLTRARSKRIAKPSKRGDNSID